MYAICGERVTTRDSAGGTDLVCYVLHVRSAPVQRVEEVGRQVQGAQTIFQMCRRPVTLSVVVSVTPGQRGEKPGPCQTEHR